MTITTNDTGKTASRVQPALSVEAVSAKTVKDSIHVLQKRPETTTDTDNAQGPAPSQTTTRASIHEPPTAESTTEWSEAEEEGDAVFARSSVLERTPPQQCCTPPDVTLAPKKKETTLLTRLRGSNATSAVHSSKQNDEANTVLPSENLIEALKKAQHTLSRDSVKKGEKLDIHQTIGLA